ncbi:hypothetical protein ABZ354_09790 [Streptomyces sp. NPDC005925]|uniref:hypothetical protein n=1 Tax=Streptomyces sp. NPDC005925 TaxID=3157172 RepID=UPI003404FE24
MSETVTLAGWKTQIFELVLGFLPDWLQYTIFGLIALLFLVYWGICIQEKIARRRAERSGRPVPAPVQPGQQGSGADYLGPYAPQRQAQQQPRPGQQGSGADHLGAYAQQPAHPGDGPRG